MRDPKRITRIVKKLAKLWKRNPDWRLMQLLSNTNISREMSDTFYTDDNFVEKELDRWLKE